MSKLQELDRDSPEYMVGYYLCVVGGDAYFENRKRLWIGHQLDWLMLQEGCFDLDWIGT